jgi:hypothetical protein
MYFEHNLAARTSLTIFTAVMLFISAPAKADTHYETHIVFKASSILPTDILKGPNHQVNEKVINDGYLNQYVINSRYGDVSVVSTDKLKKYIKEINAIERMEKVSSSDEFKSGIKGKAKSVVDGGVNLVTDPIDTVGGAVTGVGKLFSRGYENLTTDSRSDAQGSRFHDLIGLSRTKREYAYEFGVDVYSRNEVMQSYLSPLAEAGNAGGLVMSGLLVAVPGAAGTAVTVTGNTALMNNIFRDTAPVDLRSMNREKLLAMGVTEDVADLYIANGIYSPREQTLIVYALDSMKGTKNINSYIKFAILTDSPDVAFFRQRQAQMYAEYHNKVEPIDSFISVGQSSAAMTKGGKLVFNAPLDHLLWTKGVDALMFTFEQNLSKMQGVKSKEMYLTGSVSDLAKKTIEGYGWKVFSKTR